MQYMTQHVSVPDGFYAYMYLRENGTPYYIGKGKGRRAFNKSHGVHRPSDMSRILIFSRESESAALETERELISNWGRLDNETGCLRNLTNGGEQGPTGMVVSVETRLKKSKGMMGRSHPCPDHLKPHISAFQREYQRTHTNAGRFQSGHEAWNTGVSLHHNGSITSGDPRIALTKTPEAIAKQSASLRENWKKRKCAS